MFQLTIFSRKLHGRLHFAAGLIANADVFSRLLRPQAPFMSYGPERRQAYSTDSSRRRVATAAEAARIVSSSAALFLWPWT